MSVEHQKIASGIVGDLEQAWNAADGTAFAVPFAEDADFVNIRGEHYRGRQAIGQGHQAIFNSIYKGSAVGYQVTGVRPVAPDVLVAHVRSTLEAPTGPLAGRHHSLFTLVLVHAAGEWRIAAFHNTLIP